MTLIAWLDPDNTEFPSPALAAKSPNGLLAAGGDLTPARLLAAYRQGIFPWYEDEGPLLWWSPDPRMVLAPEAVHVSRSMQRLLRRARYRVSMDEAFSQVIELCSALRRSTNDKTANDNTATGTWITADMIASYTALHRLGHAHSVEVWDADELVGGLYGVSLGAMFFGESMFSIQPNTSKLAFIALARQLEQWRFTMIDCQLPTDHLFSLGAAPIPRHQFLKALEQGVNAPGKQGRWQMDLNLSAT